VADSVELDTPIASLPLARGVSRGPVQKTARLLQIGVSGSCPVTRWTAASARPSCRLTSEGGSAMICERKYIGRTRPGTPVRVGRGWKVAPAARGVLWAASEVAKGITRRRPGREVGMKNPSQRDRQGGRGWRPKGRRAPRARWLSGRRGPRMRVALRLAPTRTPPPAARIRESGRLAPTRTPPLATRIRESGRLAPTRTPPLATRIRESGRLAPTRTPPLATRIRESGRLAPTRTPPLAARIRESGRLAPAAGDGGWGEVLAGEVGAQKSALPGVRGKGITSRMLAMPVMNWMVRSRPRPKPAWGTVP